MTNAGIVEEKDENINDENGQVTKREISGLQLSQYEILNSLVNPSALVEKEVDESYMNMLNMP